MVLIVVTMAMYSSARAIFSKTIPPNGGCSPCRLQFLLSSVVASRWGLILSWVVEVLLFCRSVAVRIKLY